MPDFDKLAVENEIDESDGAFDDEEKCTCPKVVPMSGLAAALRAKACGPEIEAYVQDCPIHGWD